MKLKYLLAATAMSLVSAPTLAATIIAWDVTGQPGDQSTTAASYTAPGVGGSSLARGTGLNAASGSDSFNSNGWGSSDAADYFSFGFSVGSEYTVELDSLLLGTRSSNTGPGTIGLFSSLDGFSTAIDTITQPGNNQVNSILDLGGLDAITGSIEFRLLEIGNTQADGVGNTSDSGTFRIVDYLGGAEALDMQLTGMVVPQPVPLPASLWLFGSAVAALVCRRRGGTPASSPV